MRIALVSSCWTRTPPLGYGGTELVVGELARGFVERGHDVTVFATGDSEASGTLRSRFATPRTPDLFSDLMHHQHAWDEISKGDFEVIHCHQPMGMALAGPLASRTVYTLHHDASQETLEFYRDFPEVRRIAISRAQGDAFAPIRIDTVIHHGLNPALYPESPRDKSYVAFLGRYAPEKGTDIAIRAARRAGVPIRLGGAARDAGRAYFEQIVTPLLASSTNAVDLGELSHAPKVELLQDAQALLMPIQWEEPFGLVMIEAMLTGTPVIAFDRGSVREVVEPGITGLIVRSEEEMAEAIATLPSFDRVRCRARAQERWSTERMVNEHLQFYREIKS